MTPNCPPPPKPCIFLQPPFCFGSVCDTSQEYRALCLHHSVYLYYDLPSGTFLSLFCSESKFYRDCSSQKQSRKGHSVGPSAGVPQVDPRSLMLECQHLTRGPVFPSGLLIQLSWSLGSLEEKRPKQWLLELGPGLTGMDINK